MHIIAELQEFVELHDKIYGAPQEKPDRLAGILQKAISVFHTSPQGTKYYLKSWADNGHDMSFQSYAECYLQADEGKQADLNEYVQWLYKQKWGKTIPSGEIEEYILSFKNDSSNASADV